MKVKATSLLIALVGVTLIAAPIVYAQSIDDYDYATTITVHNGSSEALSYTPVLLAINASNLIDGGFLSSDGQDIMVRKQSGGAEADILAQFDGNPSNWWLPVDTLETNSTTSYTLYTGGNTPTADNPQFIFINGASESVEVADDSALRITSNLVVEATVTVESWPSTGTAYIAIKGTESFDYWLGVKNGDTVQAGLGQASAADDLFDILGSEGLIVPLGDTSFQNDPPTTVTTVGNTYGGASDKTFNYSQNLNDWDVPPTEINSVPVIKFNGSDEDLSTSDADYWSRGDGSNDEPLSIGGWVYLGGTDNGSIFSKFRGSDAQREWYWRLDVGKPTLALRDQSAGAEAKIVFDAALSASTWHHIVFTYDGRGGATAADGMEGYVNGEAATFTRFNNANYVAMENHGAEPTIGAMYLGADWYNAKLAGGFAGPFFTHKELSAAEAESLYNLVRIGAEPAVPEPACSNCVTIQGVASGTPLSYRFTYDGSSLDLTVGEATATNAIGSIAIGTSATALVVGSGNFVGAVQQLKIGDTNVSSPTNRLDLQFEPPHVHQTQEGTIANGWVWLGTVLDQASPSIDTTYRFVRDTTGITTTVAQTKAITTSVAQSPTDEFVNFVSELVDPFGDSFDETGGFGFPFNIIAEFASASAFPLMLLAGLLVVVIGVSASFMVYKITGMVGAALGTGILGASFATYITPMPNIAILMYAAGGLAMVIILSKRPFERA